MAFNITTVATTSAEKYRLAENVSNSNIARLISGSTGGENSTPITAPDPQVAPVIARKSVGSYGAKLSIHNSTRLTKEAY